MDMNQILSSLQNITASRLDFDKFLEITVKLAMGNITWVRDMTFIDNNEKEVFSLTTTSGLEKFNTICGISATSITLQYIFLLNSLMHLITPGAKFSLEDLNLEYQDNNPTNG